MAEFTIDPEFRDLLPPLSDDEYQRLQADINKNGCRDHLVIWKEWSTLIDGHNRHEICTSLDLPFETVEMSFHSRDEVKMWMFRNQLGRRNLTDFQRCEIALLMKPVVAAQAKDREAKGRPKEGVEILPQDTGRTRDVVAEIAGVSGKTIDKVETILQSATPEVIQQLRTGAPSADGKKISIEKAFKSVTAPVAEQKPDAVSRGEIKSRGVGIERAHEAIACLKKIPVADALRKRAFEIVKDWMNHNA